MTTRTACAFVGALGQQPEGRDLSDRKRFEQFGLRRIGAVAQAACFGACEVYEVGEVVEDRRASGAFDDRHRSFPPSVALGDLGNAGETLRLRLQDEALDDALGEGLVLGAEAIDGLEEELEIVAGWPALAVLEQQRIG